MKDKDDKIKIFSGFTVSEKFKDAFDHFQNQNKDLTNVRWTPKANLHLTLWFYGYISMELLENVLALNTVLKTQMNSTTLTLSKLKIAPTNQNGRMVWASYEPNKAFKEWIGLHDLLLPKLNLGERDYKQIRPHVTLARFKENKYQNKDFETQNHQFPPTLDLNTLIIWESLLEDKKIVYKQLISNILM